jgi:hypothetical protein
MRGMEGAVGDLIAKGHPPQGVTPLRVERTPLARRCAACVRLTRAWKRRVRERASLSELRSAISVERSDE